MVYQAVVSRKKQSRYCVNKVTLLSPAKINLYFNILGKYPSGFHRLESIVERISLCDKIILEIAQHNDIKIFCNLKDLENKNNLCVKAAKLLKEKYRIKHGFNIYLTKNIPVGAGLGGGSSNAASIILGINKLCRLHLNQKVLYNLGGRIGSDVNFFLAQTDFAQISGRGEKVQQIQGKSLKHTIIWPNINLSTKDVYGAYKAKLTKFIKSDTLFKFALERGDLVLIRASIFNALEKPALSLCGKLRTTKTKLLDNNIFARVTGSGSALYTISENSVYQLVRRILPKNWFICEVHTLTRSCSKNLG
ncbi:MAG: 4-(cytidine 5'-diphospho)-2-C-methyl-D-erythritol kinase [Candidatus Omnitrophota bacterium]|jgi:4-diphosphocytidyl-2-C-methyl-D-erythritol kinase